MTTPAISSANSLIVNAGQLSDRSFFIITNRSICTWPDIINDDNSPLNYGRRRRDFCRWSSVAESSY